MRTKVFLAILLIAFLTVNGFAQNPEKRFGFELNGGVSMTTNKVGEAKLKPGFGFEGIFHYRFMPHLGVYGGWGWNHFGADHSFAGADVCFEETGYVLGLQFKCNFGNWPIAYFLRAGGLYNHIEIENNDGDIIGDTGHGLGCQFATGIEYTIGKNWSLLPGIKFNHLNRDVEIGETVKNLNHNYLSLRIGFLKRF